MSEPIVFAIVLAAGTSSRFGSTKQLQNIDGSPMVRRAVEQAEAVCGGNTILVTGWDFEAVAAACRPLAGFFVVNENFDAGLGGSIACAVDAVSDVANAILVTLADQPRVSAEHLGALIGRWRGERHGIVATAYAGTAGAPVVFPESDFDALSRLSGDRGARALLDAHRERLITVACEEAALDIDRREDLEKL